MMKVVFCAPTNFFALAFFRHMVRLACLAAASPSVTAAVVVAAVTGAAATGVAAGVAVAPAGASFFGGGSAAAIPPARDISRQRMVVRGTARMF